MTEVGRQHPVRWTTEERVLAELEDLGDLSMQTAQEYREVAQRAARAEAAHKALRATRILLAQTGAKASGGRASVAQAETVAEADPDVAAAYEERLISAALADACRESLRSIRTNQDGLRTAAASKRTPFAGPGYQ